MQSGTTGINTLRIYSPAKQMRDQDPEGAFVRRWIPELEGVPLEYLAEPHLMAESVQRRSGCRIGIDYPSPVVEHATAYREARARFVGRRTFERRRRRCMRVTAVGNSQCGLSLAGGSALVLRWSSVLLWNPRTRMQGERSKSPECSETSVKGPRSGRVHFFWPSLSRRSMR
jgi:hypothetical protein